jgi:hypothetical protein
MKSELKNITFEYDPETDSVTITNATGTFTVPKQYLFSLSRFLLRVFQKNFKKHVKKNK